MCLDRYRVIALKTLVTRARSNIYFMPKYFADIIGKFGHRQRVFVLVVLLVFSSGTYLLGTYLKQDDCSDLRRENIDLHRDFIAISQMIRQERARKQEHATHVEEAEEAVVEEAVIQDTIWIEEPIEAVEDTVSTDTTFTIIDIPDEVLDNILRISESHGTGLMFNGPR